jgi:hypothetical protein
VNHSAAKPHATTNTNKTVGHTRPLGALETLDLSVLVIIGKLPFPRRLES